MTEPKKLNKYQRYIKPHLDIVMFFTIIAMGVTFYLEYEKGKLDRTAKDKDIEQRIYPTPQRLIKAMEHDDEVPSDVENFKREIRLIQTGDSLKTQQQEINENIKVIDSFYQFEKRKAIKDSIDDLAKQKSRDKRTQDIEQMKREQQNIGNTLQTIQRTLLDTIK